MRTLVAVVVAVNLVVACIMLFAVFKFFSSGEVEVPDIRGKSLLEASKILWNRGLALVVEGESSETTYPAGTILAQRPAPGRKVRTSRPIFVTISSRRDVVSVPNVVGKKLQEARSEVGSKGLRVGKVIEEFAPENAGVVFQQFPQGGSYVSPEALVALVSSLGPPPVVRIKRQVTPEEEEWRRKRRAIEEKLGPLPTAYIEMFKPEKVTRQVLVQVFSSKPSYEEAFLVWEDSSGERCRKVDLSGGKWEALIEVQGKARFLLFYSGRLVFEGGI